MAALNHTLALLAGTLLLGPALGASNSADVAQTVAAALAPAALTQPAILSAKAGGAVMLALARAGQRLVAAGERGIVLLSDDNGASWRQVPTPVQVSLVALQFATPELGWAVGHLGVVLHTADGGLSWTKQFDGLQAAERMAAAATTPVAARAAAQLRADGPDKPFLDLYFSDASHGYILGAYHLLFRTSDGGRSWQPWQDRVDNPRNLHLYGLRGAGKALYLVGEQGMLFRSRDQGASFEALASPYQGSYFGLVAAPGGELVAFGLRGSAYWSGDEGRSWRQVDTGLQQALTAGIVLADGSLALLSQGGDVLISRDQGRSFARSASSQPLPAAALAQAADGALVVAGLRGVRRLAPATAPTPASATAPTTQSTQ
ncbi:glycosyl hydrolase [Oxalobacteraceae bacterium]|nr:glycosyl hydrolase [Oxalobacteraceae bacterium]